MSIIEDMDVLLLESREERERRKVLEFAQSQKAIEPILQKPSETTEAINAQKQIVNKSRTDDYLHFSNSLRKKLDSLTAEALQWSDQKDAWFTELANIIESFEQHAKDLKAHLDSIEDLHVQLDQHKDDIEQAEADPTMVEIINGDHFEYHDDYDQLRTMHDRMRTRHIQLQQSIRFLLSTLNFYKR